jgi:hypothetical protein
MAFNTKENKLSKRVRGFIILTSFLPTLSSLMGIDFGTTFRPDIDELSTISSAKKISDFALSNLL